MKYLDYFFITRPILFFPGWATLLLGRWYGNLYFGSKSFSVGNSILPGFGDILLIPGFGFLMGGCFILNQIADIETDRLNSKLYFLHEGHVSAAAAWREALILILLGTALFFYNGNFDLVIIALLFVFITGYFYNFNPFRAKDRVLSGLMANILMGEAAFAMGFLFEAPHRWQTMLIASIPLLLINTGLYVLTTLPDIGGDRESNKKTIGAWLGVEKGIIAGGLLIVGGLFFLPFPAEWSWIALIFSLPPVLYMFFKRELKTAVIALKFTIFGVALSVSLYWIWFAVLGIAAFWFTKYYFRKRFNADYPNFSGE